MTCFRLTLSGITRVLHKAVRSTKFMLLAVPLGVAASPATAQVKGLPQAAPSGAMKWAVVFDFDTDSCYPAPAVSPDGVMNGGLRPSGHITGQCRRIETFKNANTYHRGAAIEKDGVKFGVHMYALYFQKDQWQDWTPRGGPNLNSHRHDWEYALVWTKDGTMTHASFSSHGGLTTKAIEDLNFDRGKPDTVKAVYHKDGVATHCFRPAKANEAPENELREWVTPALVDWGMMKSDKVSNEVLRMKFNAHDFGAANCPFNDKNFRKEIAKKPPPGYPRSDEWKEAPLDPKRPRNYSKEPSKPDGLVARWHVLDGRERDRDNRKVDLARGQRARIVVHLPAGVREKFHFNLKHDRSNASDRGRTQRIGHGDIVSGDAHNWPGFETRIYLGERDGSDQHGFDVAPGGFYVDLVLLR